MTKSKAQVKSEIQKFIKKINNFFINIILFLFYFLIIGLGALIYGFFKKRNKEANSYWQDYPQKELGLDYFKSSY